MSIPARPHQWINSCANFNFSLFLAWLQLSWQLVSLRPPARGSNHVATNRAEKKGDAHEAMGLAPRRQESHRRGCSPMPDTKSLHAIRSNVKALNASKVPTSRITTKRSLLRSKWRRPHQGEGRANRFHHYAFQASLRKRAQQAGNNPGLGEIHLRPE